MVRCVNLNNWTRVEDSLPEDGVVVLVYYSNVRAIGEYIEGYWVVGMEDYVGVKYWQPLPKSPE